MRTFIRQFLPSLLATAIPLFLAAWITHLLNWPKIDGIASFLTLAPLYLAYIVPVGLLVHGIRVRNDPVTAGAIAGWAVFWLSGAIALQMQGRAIVAFTLVTGPLPQSAFLTIDSGYCDSLCVQVLATSDYQIVFERYRSWEIYRRGEGDACATSFETTGMFLAAGYPGMCALKERRSTAPNGIFVNEYEFAGKGLPRKGASSSDPSKRELEYRWDRAEIAAIAPWIPGFIGSLIEGGIRINGEEEVVERRFIGRLESPTELMTLSLASGPLTVGKAADRAAAYGRLLGLDLDPTRRPGPLQLAEILDRLEALLLAAVPTESSEFAATYVPPDDARRHLARLFGMLAHEAEGHEAVAVTVRLQRLLQSDKPALIYAVLNSMVEPHDLDQVRPALAALIDGRNPDIVAIAARRADEQFHLREDPEIRRRVVEIPFRLELFQRESELTPLIRKISSNDRRFDVKSLPGQEVGRRIIHDDAYRTRAIRVLISAPRLIPGHCDLLLRIVAHGADAASSKQQALEAFLATQPETFAACATRIRDFHYDRTVKTLALSREQVLVLRDRAGLVPSDVLVGYWKQFLSHSEIRSLSDEQMLAVVNLRLAEDDKTHALKERTRSELLWLRDELLKS